MGRIEWDKHYGGDYDDRIYDLQKTSDGGYIMVGEKRSGPNNTDAWLIKTDSSGNKEWEKTKSSTGDHEDTAISVVEISNGNFVIAGDKWVSTDNYDAWVFVFDAQGNYVTGSEKLYGGAYVDSVSRIRNTTDGGYILAGRKSSGEDDNDADAWLVKLDTSLGKSWEQVFGEGEKWDSFNDVRQIDEGYIATGGTESWDALATRDVFVIQTDNSGNKIWRKHLKLVRSSY